MRLKYSDEEIVETSLVFPKRLWKVVRKKCIDDEVNVNDFIVDTIEKGVKV